MKKILIGTHNKGKFKEIAILISKKYRKISPYSLKIKSPKETGKTFTSNSRLKVKFFSKHVNFPVISDDSGLCIQSLKNKPGIYSARLAKKHGSFLKAMKYILKKWREKKIEKQFLYVVFPTRDTVEKLYQQKVGLKGKFLIRLLEKKGLGMIQFLYL